MKRLVFLLGVSLIPSLATGQNLRPLAADRPDSTESPQTVDKGYFQVETSIADYSTNKADQTTTTSMGLFETNLKYGMTDSIDVHLVIQPYIEEETKVSGNKSSISSHGDVEIRSKINLW